MSIKVSELIADFLEKKKIRHVFGIIGAGNANIFDAISRKGFTEIVCVHHEQAAVMAMGAYYRIAGTISASLVTTGGGSANAVTGVVNCWMDSIPGIVISGNENSKFTSEKNPLRIWGIQGFDSVRMVQGITKYAKRVKNPLSIRAELEKAYYICSTGRPGPVWLDVPMNIQATHVEQNELTIHNPKTVDQYKTGEEFDNLELSVTKLGELLSQSARPLIWLGHGIRLAGAVDLIEPILDKLGIPALVSWQGIDMIDSNHPLIIGRAGVYGQRAANIALQNCDFLLTIGTRLAIPQIGYEINEFAREARIAMVDIDPDEIKKFSSRIDLPICADARLFFQKFLEIGRVNKTAKVLSWKKQCQVYNERFPIIDKEHEDKNDYINSYPFMDRLSKKLKPDQIIVTDMGTALLSGHQVLNIKKGQRLLTSTGLGEMGYGLPGAIGASFACDKGEVICLNCDGGMMMNLQELQTIAHHRLPIKIIIFNNEGYLMIKHTQKSLFEGRYIAVNKESGVSCPNFSKLAKAFDFKSYQIRTWDDFEEYIPQILVMNEPVICNVFTHPEQLFVPKLSLAAKKDGSIVSPPLEDLYPFISLEDLRKNMIIKILPKSESIER